MFTGIVQAVGQVETAAGCALTISAPELALQPGDSVAVNGVCLTVTGVNTAAFDVDLSPQTRGCTTLGGLAAAARVNLEPALRLGDPLGGHLVSGHVDGVGEVLACRAQEDCLRLSLRVPAELRRYVCLRGSLCVDGVGLTVAGMTGECCELSLVPYTLGHTTLGEALPGSPVNLEVDQLARYVERLLEERAGEPG